MMLWALRQLWRYTVVTMAYWRGETLGGNRCSSRQLGDEWAHCRRARSREEPFSRSCAIALRLPVADQPVAMTRIDSGRIAGPEWLRFFCSIGIVWFHAKAPAGDCAYAALPALMMLSVYLAASRSHAAFGERAIVRRRVMRLILPWLFWSAIYGLATCINCRCNGQIWHEDLRLWMLFAGTALHLWYLPAAFVCTTLVALGARKLCFRRQWLACLTWAVVGAVAILVSSYLEAGTAGRILPLAQWLFVAPSVPLALALATIPRGPGRWPRVCASMAIVAAVVLACVVALERGAPGLTIPYSIGIVACTASIHATCRASAFTVWVSGLSFGCYLTHPLVIALLGKAAELSPTCLAVTASAISLAVTAVLRVTYIRRFI